MINKEITEVDIDVRKDFDKSSDRDKGKSKEDICLFTPDHPICDPDKDGNCDKGWGMNENGDCFPKLKKCPDTHWRANDDETGKCVPKPPVLKPHTPAPSPKSAFISEPPCEAGLMPGIEATCPNPNPNPSPEPVKSPEPSPKPSPEPDTTIDFREPVITSPDPSPMPDDTVGDEELTANCGGVPCTPTEKEDSTLDDDTEIVENTNEFTVENTAENEPVEEVEEDTSDESESSDDSESDGGDSDGGEDSDSDGGDGDGDSDGGDGETTG